MRISSISMTMESRVNYGDYQGAMANLTVGAELGDETPEEGFKQLRAMLQQQLVYCIKSGSPNTMRTLLKDKDADGEADAGTGKATKKPATKKPATKPKTKPKDELDDDDGPDEGNDLDDDDGNGLEDDDGLGEEEEIDRPKVMAALRDLKAEKGAAAMQQVIKKTGAASFKEVPNEDLEKLYKLAVKKRNE